MKKKYKLKNEIKILILKMIILMFNTYILNNIIITTNTVNDFRYNILVLILYAIIEILTIIF